jgi:carbonic anhydrase
MGFILGIILIVGVAYAVRFYQFKRDKARKEAMIQIAKNLGITYTEKGIPDWRNKFDRLKFFNKGEDIGMNNILSGTANDTFIAIFDYSYKIRSSINSAMYHNQTVFLIDTLRLSLPAFELVPKQHIHKMMKAVSDDEIVFENYKEFTERYYLIGDDANAVRETLDQKKLEFILSQPEIRIEGNGTALLFHHTSINTPSTRMDVNLIESSLKRYLETATIFMN